MNMINDCSNRNNFSLLSVLSFVVCLLLLSLVTAEPSRWVSAELRANIARAMLRAGVVASAV
jgi:uncharacterized membrane protein (DUF485 family)